MVKSGQQIKPVEKPPVQTSRRERVPRSKKTLFIIMAVIGIFAVAVVGLMWWHDLSTHESTDDAYVMAHIHNISSRINGTVTYVKVDEHQPVKAGEVLAKLDPQDYLVQVEQAQAALRLAQQQAAAALVGIPEVAANAQAKAAQATGGVRAAQASIAQAEAAVSEAGAGVENARAGIDSAQANLVKAQQDYQRYRLLASQGAIPVQQLDQATAALRAATAQREAAADAFKAAEQRVKAARANLAQSHANLVASRGQISVAEAGRIAIKSAQAQAQTARVAVEQAAARLHEAQIALSYTTITSPVRGITGKRQIEVGQRVQAGQPVFSIVEQVPWIEANYKETQLGRMRPGQIADIEIDGIPGKHFRGVIKSISPASGAQFALLPPQNATGNFTKVVQRIPVRIEFDRRSIAGYEDRIVAGMSTVVRVTVGR